jgi:hypothetical protein
MNTGLARRAKHVMQKRARIKRRKYREDLRAGLVRGPMTIAHQNGLPHEWRKCPVCTMAHIRAVNTIPPTT